MIVSIPRPARSTICARASIPLLDGLGHVVSRLHGGQSRSALARSSVTWQLLRDHLLGNPHSTNPTSALATTFIEQTRLSVLDFFNADPDEYVVIFTANATQALKLVGEAYPFDAGGEYLLDVRQPQLGERHPRVRARQRLPDHLRADRAARHARGRGGAALASRACGRGGHRLFAYPAQSNFSGVQHPLDWIPLAQERGWDVLLDAAAFTPTNRLDLDRWKPDFVSQSFYKMFGYPTGVGCLIAARLRLRSCAGRGLRAARSPSRRCRETSSTLRKARRLSKTARRTTSRCPRSSSGSSTCRRLASTRFTRASAA